MQCAGEIEITLDGQPLKLPEGCTGKRLKKLLAQQLGKELSHFRINYEPDGATKKLVGGGDLIVDKGIYKTRVQNIPAGFATHSAYRASLRKVVDEANTRQTEQIDANTKKIVDDAKEETLQEIDPSIIHAYKWFHYFYHHQPQEFSKK